MKAFQAVTQWNNGISIQGGPLLVINRVIAPKNSQYMYIYIYPPSNYPRDPGNPFCRFNLVGLKVLVQNGFTPKNNICCKLVIPTLTCSKTKAATKRKTQGTRSKTLPNINWCWNWIAILWQNICHIWSCHVFFREPICSNTPSWIQSMHDVQMPSWTGISG